MKLFYFFIYFLLALSIPSTSIAVPFTQQEKQILINHYASYFPQSFLENIFNKPHFQKNISVIPKNIINKENPKNYDQFTTPWAINISFRFLKKWRSTFIHAERKFHVDREVIVAIFMVETGLGGTKGNYSLLSTFSTLTLLYGQAKKHPNQYTKVKRQRIYKKGKWAESELKQLLLIIQENKFPQAVNLHGSFAGAFGLPQFLPSSYMQWGYDSDRNGTINLFLIPDSIYSTGNYLMAHGWKHGLLKKSLQKNHIQVIKQYNHSSIYASTVLKLAKKIRSRYSRHILYMKLKLASKHKLN